MRPRSINIFLLDGDPNGVRVAQISMSTIQERHANAVDQMNSGEPDWED